MYMAQYKVPQDVEAEDKLIGPFTFRQFIYLMIVAGLIAITVSLFNLSPVLAAIPVPFIIFFAILALPLKKEQPMETYLSALVSFILKPHNRYWTPGERESTIEITAPKIVEEPRARELSGTEAGHRLSFLADIVDTEGFSIEEDSNLREDFLAENYDAEDIFESGANSNINRLINDKNITDRRTVMNNFQQSISNSRQQPAQYTNPLNSDTVIRPLSQSDSASTTRRAEIEAARKKARESAHTKTQAELTSLSQNTNKTIAELASAANKITEGDK